MEEIRRIRHVLFVNNSKAANTDMFVRALSSFSNIYWIAGGKPKAWGGIESLDAFSRALGKLT